MTLELVNGTWCPAGDPYFEPLLQSGQFYDRWTLEQALPHVRQRRLCLDIGAHIGTWTVQLAREFQLVVAFEPDPQNFTALIRNLAISEIENVRALPLAVAHRSGRFCLSHEGCVNSGEGYLTPVSEGDDWVIGLKLDDAQFIEVDLIKLDAEGLEWEILANGERTVCANQPVIILEENQRVGARYGGTAADARVLLQDWGMVEVARREFIDGVFDVVLAWPNGELG